MDYIKPFAVCLQLKPRKLLSSSTMREQKGSVETTSVMLVLRRSSASRGTHYSLMATYVCLESDRGGSLSRLFCRATNCEVALIPTWVAVVGSESFVV